MSKKFYITTPIYYVNDKPHIGHAYTTIAADVLARYYRQKGDEVFFLTGTDEHGDKVAKSAEENNMDVEKFVDQNATEFQKTFANLKISNDIFMRTTLREHNESVQIFMKKLHAAGAIYQSDYEGLYCRGCEDFYTEKDLAEGLCPVHKVKPELVKEKNWFFKLEEYLPRVEHMIEWGEMIIEPASRKNEVLGLFKQGLKDFSVTRERVKWGLDFPIDSSQKIYVWVEALQNYISAIGYGRDDKQFNKWWPVNVHLMAKDIIKFHAIYWPAMLIAVGVKLPKKIFAHGFFTLNGQKMSKSLGNVIDPNAMVEQYGVDGTRYLLLSQFPFGQDGDIKESLFKEKYNADLANNLGNLVSRVFNMIEQYCDGKVNNDEEWPFPSIVHFDENMQLLRFDQVLKDVWIEIAAANQLIDNKEPWILIKDEKNKEEVNKVMSQLVDFLYKIATYIMPFMPDAAASIVGGLNADKITKGEPLFKRL